MKEQSASGHGSVVATSPSSHTPSSHGRHQQRKHTDNNNSSKCFGGPCLDTDDEDEDWEEDLGIGKLVIDLDADADKAGSPPSAKHSSCNNSPSSAQAPNSANTSPHLPTGKSAMESSIGHSGDKGLKMKIKRSNSGKSVTMMSSTSALAIGSTSALPGQQPKQDNSPGTKTSDNRLGFSGAAEGTGNSATLQNTVDRIKHSLAEKERSATNSNKNRNNSKKDRASKSKAGGSNEVQNTAGVMTPAVSPPASSPPVSMATTPSGNTASPSAGVTSNVTVDLDRISMTPFASGTANVKRENPSHDPYEFNAKVEDRIGVPMKKMKVEKSDAPSSGILCVSPAGSDRPEPASTQAGNPSPQSSERQIATQQAPQQHDMAVGTSHVGVITEPDCLGPCEPGTSVVLEGIVWNETDNGLLVVNVTWRGKTYVGTLMDATKHDWAPPRLNCDSPTDEIDSRTPKGRGKRGRGAGPPPRPIDNGSDRKLRSNRRNTNNVFSSISSPARIESLSAKRKARCEPDPAMFEPPKPNKRTRTDSRMSDYSEGDSQLIECPEPNCSKKYRHINGLKYHQSHAHKDSNDSSKQDSKDDKPSTSELSPLDTSNSMMDTIISPVAGRVLDKSPASKIKEEPMELEVENGRSDDDKTSTKSSTSIETETNKFMRQNSVSSVCEDSSHASYVSSGTTATSADVITSNTSSTVSTISMPTVGVCIVSTEHVASVGSTVHLVATAGNSINNASPQFAVSSFSTVQSTVKPIAVTALTTLPVVVTTITATRPNMTTPSPSKHDGEKKKKDKSEKHKNKTATATRPIMPAPSSTHMNISQAPISTQAGVAQVSTVSSQLKPIQPKPTILGETNKVNPALASLKEMKEKKPKKKKNKDKDRERHKDSSKSHHEHKNKASAPSVIKPAPNVAQTTSELSGQTPLPKVVIAGSADSIQNVLGQLVTDQQKLLVQRPMDNQGKVLIIPSDAQQRVLIQRPTDSHPKILIQRPTEPQNKGAVPRHNVPIQQKQPQAVNQQQLKTVRLPSGEQTKVVVSNADPPAKEAPIPPQLEKQPVNLVKERSNVSNRTLQTLAPGMKIGDGSNQPRGNQEPDAHSPAYSDISDANESAPTLEKETQPSQPDAPQHERPPSIQTQELGSYYGQPPFLTPAVPPTSLDGKCAPPISQPTKQAIKVDVKDSTKSRSTSILSPVGEKRDSVSRPSSATPQTEQKPASHFESKSNQNQSQQKANMVANQQQFAQYYGIDPNHAHQMASNPEYRERVVEEQRRRQEQSQQQQLQMQQHQRQPNMNSQQNALSHASGQNNVHNTTSHLAPGHVKLTAQQNQPSPQQKVPIKNQSHPTNQQISISQPSPNTSQTSQLSPSGQLPSPHSQQQQQNSPQVKNKQSKTPQTKPQQSNQTQVQRSKGSHLAHHHNLEQKISQATKVHSQTQDSKGDQNRRPKEDAKVDDRGTQVQKPPPSLISDREREEQKRRERERTEQNLREKQNENRQILKENIELKEQMDNRNYDSKTLGDKHREDLQRYYMYQQQRYLEHQRHADNPAKPMVSPHSASESSQDGKPDGPSNSKDERPRSVDRGSAASSPRVTPKLEKQGPSPVHHQIMAGVPVPVSYAQYYSQFQHMYGGHVPFDPNHPGMYPGVNPVIGYPGPAFIHPAQLRYHIPNNGEPIPVDRMMMMSPRPDGGKALDLLQQHAHYYSNNGNPQHKIHELENVAKRSDKGRSTSSPATKDTERPNSCGSAGPDTAKLRDTRHSPPTQRHLHTHHHTHVMGASAYPPIQYDPYGAAIMTSPSAPAAISAHPFVPK